jgi:hypothetical protein
MHARLTRFTLKPGKREDWIRFREEADGEVRALKGLKHWIGLVGDNDDVVVVAIYDYAASIEESMPALHRLWERSAHLMEEQPSTVHYEVVRFDTV